MESEESISTTQVVELLRAMFRDRLQNGHHLKSMDTFYLRGIGQIITTLFSVDLRIQNSRNQTDEDKGIDEIICRVEFSHAQLRRPVHPANAQQELYPASARTSMLTYSSALEIDAKIIATAYKNG